MSKNVEENTTKANTDYTEIKLQDGRIVTIKEPTTPQVIKSRQLAVKNKNSVKTYLYLIAECCLFDGKPLPAAEIEKLKPRDYLRIEHKVQELLGEFDESDEDDEKN